MEVITESISIVKPALPTWQGHLALSEFEQVGTMGHVPTIHFYEPLQYWRDQPQKLMNLLKDSLSRALVHFFPLAGRLHFLKGSRLFLNCNAMGAHFIEAKSNSALEDFGDFSPSPAMKNLVPSLNYKKPIEEIPLIFVQVTKFKCGGICIGTYISHVIADGTSNLHFRLEWARLARGEKVAHEPFHDRKALRAGEPLLSSPPATNFFHYNYRPLVIGKTSRDEESEMKTSVINLKLTGIQVSILKKLANEGRVSGNERAYTRYEAITGHIWRSVCKARMHQKEQPTALQVCVDIRSRMGHQLPKTYFGKGTIEVLATSTSGELISRPLGYAASRIRETVDMVDDKYINLGIDYLKSQKDLSSFQELHELINNNRAFFGNPNLVVASWLSFPVNSDFGFGKEISKGLAYHDFDGDLVIMPGDGEDGSVILLVCIQVRHKDAFRKYFYEGIKQKNSSL